MNYPFRSFVTGVTVLLAVFVLASPAVGDHFIRQVHHTDAYEIMGQKQAAVDDTTVIWLTEGKSCMLTSGDESYIYIADDMKLYVVDHNARKYSETSTDAAAALEEAMADMDDEERAMAEAMQQQMMQSMRLTVTPTEETKKIGDWNTTRYMMEMSMPMGNATTEMWVTDDVEADWESFQAMANSQMAAMPGFEQMLEETKKIKGIPVYSVTSTQVMGVEVKSTVEILEFLTKDAPAGTFAVPEGYRKVDVMQSPTGQ
ncbi:MAG: DUF4412 domain-containing protein [Candidatus Zixiibacteriota bacterium]|nr:MAG: DUF4412 domain-containing protein [candidate division Zixibacteria bacterium]